MKDRVRVLLGCLILSGGIAASYPLQIKQTVSAKTRETFSTQQEKISTEHTSTTFSEASKETVESGLYLESSSIEVPKYSETSEMSSTVFSSESENVIEESLTESADSIPKISEIVTKVQTALPTEKVEENYQFSVVKNQTTEEFIHLISKDAQKIAWNEGLYASVMIAQAILETGSGNSQLARPPHHNLFGIKGSHQGKNVTFNTQEDKGNGQLYTIKSAFRQYPSYKESLEDYAALLKKGISGNADFYQATWKEHAATYKEATKALTGKYATDTSYDRKLNALIEMYSLTMYDSEPNIEETSDSLEITHGHPAASVEQTENKTPESKTTEEPKILRNEIEQPVITIPPVTQRPAKELAGKRLAQ